MYKKILEHDVKIARDAIEKIIFGENRLEKLKEKISDLERCLINGNELKKTIILEFGEAINEISEFIPFYVENLMNNKSIKSITSENDIISLKKRIEDKEAIIQEKDEFIEEIIQRCDIIFKKIEE